MAIVMAFLRHHLDAARRGHAESVRQICADPDIDSSVRRASYFQQIMGVISNMMHQAAKRQSWLPELRKLLDERGL